LTGNGAIETQRQARDELDEISVGTHTRFVVEVAKTVERLKAKSAKYAARSN
jgi:hypothetical protein